jgi:hypothetical protein
VFASLSLVLAAQAPQDPASGLARFEREFGSGWTVWHGPQGVPYRVFGPGAQVLPVPGVQTLADARTAVAALVARHGAWLGVEPGGMREVHHGEGRLVVSLAYQQTHRGVPVWNAYLKFTFNRGDGGLAIFGSEAVRGLDVEVAQPMPADAAVARFGALTGWRPDLGSMHHAPELEIAPGEDGVYRLAWRVTAEFSDRTEAWSIWIDARTGAELKRESQIHYCGVCAHDDEPPPAPLIGNVSGWISPLPGGLAPGVNPEELTPMPNILVSVAGVGTAFTDGNGDFSIPFSGTTPQIATISLPNGQWWSTLTDDSATPIESQTVSLTPGVPTNIVFNAGLAQFTTAQVNAVHYTGRIHDYVKSVVPTMNAIDAPVTVRVNINQSCNAFFSGSSINFYRMLNTCNNTAAGGVVAHEYGHSVDARNGGIGSTPRTPSEGIADVHSIYLLDSPVIGMDFYIANRNGIRDGRNTLTHPLTGSSQAVHTFGQPYMGFSWDFLTQARATYGGAMGYQIAETAMFESIVTNPRDMIDYILDAYEADDNDSDLNNGTPHIDVLAKAALARHFIRPVFHPVKIAHTPLADRVDGSAGLTVDANVTTTIGAVTTVTLFVDTGTGSFTSLAMANVGGSAYRATSAATVTRGLARYYIEARNDRGNLTRLPAENGDALVVAVGQKNSLFSDDFEAANANFTLGATWSRHTPIGRNFDPPAAAGGSFVMGTNRSATDERMQSASGTVTLTSRAIPTAGAFGVRLRFRRWATNSNNGVCSVLINGTAVQTAPTPNDQDWRTFDLDVSALADNRASVVLTFTNQTTTSDNVGGFTIDNVDLYALNTPCPVSYYSPGLSGVNGVPSLTPVGDARIGNATFAFRLSNAAANAPIGWIVGGATAFIPFLGGIVAVRPDIIFSTSTTPSGDFTLAAAVPPDAGLIGLSIYTQVAVIDGAAPQGMALTQAMRTTFCPLP